MFEEFSWKSVTNCALLSWYENASLNNWFTFVKWRNEYCNIYVKKEWRKEKEKEKIMIINVILKC